MTKKRQLRKLFNINYRYIARSYLARPVAFIALFTTSAYGVRALLNGVGDTVASLFALLLVFCLSYILFSND